MGSGFFDTVQLRRDENRFLVEIVDSNIKTYIVKGRALAEFNIYFTPESEYEPESRGAELQGFMVDVDTITNTEDEITIEEGDEDYDTVAKEFEACMLSQLKDEAQEYISRRR